MLTREHPPFAGVDPKSRFSIGNIAPAQQVERLKAASYSILRVSYAKMIRETRHTRCRVL